MGGNEKTERVAIIDEPGININYNIDRGCPQGSRSGPGYWNIMYDSIFDIKFPVGCEVVSFADDTTLLVKSKQYKNISKLANIAGKEISNKIGAAAKISWGLNGKAASVIYKGAVELCMFYAASIWENKIKDVKSRNKLISVQRVLDLKAARAFSTVSNDAFGVSGLLPADVRFKEIALWQNLYILNDQDLRLFTGVDINHDKIEKEAKFLTDIHPAKRDIMDFKSRKIVLNKGIQLFTDGAKIGAAFAVFCDGVEVYFEKIKLGALCDNYHAELLAVNSAIKYVIKEKIDKCELYSDSISVLKGLKNMKKPSILHDFFWIKGHSGIKGNERADQLAKEASICEDLQIDLNVISKRSVKNRIRKFMLKKWQDRWDNLMTGRLTYQFIPRVGRVDRFLKPETVELITGHGNFEEYLNRIGKFESPLCLCGVESGTSMHVLFRCKNKFEERCRLQNRMLIKGMSI
nr:uncharacterized protein LOC111418384 [Onthophagus taurus]